jgi:Ca2+-binding RTX toxin-like protein
MIDLSKYYDMATLAEASYVLFDDLANFLDTTVKLALSDPNCNGTFSATQAADFVDHWEVVSHQGNTENGFSATLFKNKETGEYVYACRGTEPSQLIEDLIITDITDIVTDGLAIKQIVDMYNNWQQLNASQGQVYQVASLDLLAEETALLLLARAAGVGSAYELYLRSRSDIIIDDPTGQVYTINTDNWSDQIYDSGDSRIYGLGEVTSGDSITVVGHSLGGHLATAFTRLFPETGAEAITINGAGFMTGLVEGLSGNAEVNIANLFSMLGGDNSFDSSKILNLYGEKGLEVTTMDQIWGLEQQGQTLGIFIEDSGVGNTLGHGKEQMTDSLAVYNLFLQIDSTLSMADITAILNSSSYVAENSLESAVSDIGQLLQTGLAVRAGSEYDGSRDLLYTDIEQIELTLAGRSDLTVELLGIVGSDGIFNSFSSNEILSYAQNDIAYRYALVSLNPFAVTGDDGIYNDFNQNGELDLYDSATGEGELSSNYLQDRAEMLFNLIKANIIDSPESDSAVIYKDVALNITLNDPNLLDVTDPNPDYTIAFGGENNDTLRGTSSNWAGDHNDRLYGMAGNDTIYGYSGDDYIEGGIGNDTLNGGEGNDTLVGGEGLDTYVISDGDGNDTIRDSDGAGRIVITDEYGAVAEVAVGNFTRTTEGGNEWISSSGNITLTQGESWFLTLADGSTITLDSFEDGFLGITLVDGFAEPTDPPDVTSEIFGDPLIHSTTVIPGGETQDWHVVQTYNYDYVEDGEGNQVLVSYDVDYYLVDDNGNPTEGGGEVRDDVGNLHDTGADDHFMSGGGDDVINLDLGGDDYVETGSGEDLVNVYSTGNHVIELGDDNDKLYTLTGDAGNLTVDGGAGRDYLGGGSGEDIIVGGEGADGLYGSGGNDFIYGDAEGDASDFIAQGATEIGTGLQGEWVDAEDGNDQVFTGAGNDLIAGGDGDDLIVTGGGTDWIWGDKNTMGSFTDDWFGWSVTETVTVDGNSTTYTYGIENLYIESNAGVGNDVIYAGAGDDVAFGERGDDFIFVEAGNDKCWGGEGSDVISGGAGDDIMVGDNAIGALAEDLHGDDYLDGGDGNDTLHGNGGSDILIGGNGNDTMFGDDLDQQVHGDDYLYGGSGEDTMLGLGGEDVLFGGEDDDIIYGDSSDTPWDQQLADMIYGEEGDDSLYGNGGDDYLSGGSGDDVLWGGDGNDILLGGDDNDTLLPGLGMDTMDGGAGDDIYYYTVGSGVKYLSDVSGHDRLILSDISFGMISLSLGSLMISSGVEGDELHLDGVDYDNLIETSPIEVVQFSDGQTMTVAEIVEAIGIDYETTENADSVTGTSARDNINALAGNDVISTGAGNDIIDLGAGDDTADAGAGDDIVTGGEGADTITAGDGADTVSGDAGADILYGDAGADLLYGGDDNDSLSGGDDDDQLYGELGDDVLYGDAGADLLYGGDDNDSLSGGDDDDQLYGDLGDDVLYGDAGNDVLDGGAGSDVMAGGAGDDTYYVDSATDTVSEGLDAGSDLVVSTLDYVLGGNVENLALAEGSAATLATGNALANSLSGNSLDNTLSGLDGDDVLSAGAGNDTLDGGSGADTMIGGAGDDTYLADNVSDSIVEAYGEGLDQVTATVSYTLAENVETLILSGENALDGTGNTGDNVIYGNDWDNVINGATGDDELYGGTGNDTLVGGAGIDLLVGGMGNDLYSVDNEADVVVENADEGTDTVESSITYTLSDTIEHLTLIGSADLDGNGNAFANVLTGNSGDNVLSGGGGDDELYGGAGNDRLVGDAGLDSLYGGLGNDTYVDDGEDIIVEYADEGIDTLESAHDIILGDYLENAVLTGDVAVNATGNDLDNTLTGNSAANVLDGGLGDDWLSGGGGDDIYYTDSAADTLYEYSDQGTDTEIRSHESLYLLSANVENLILTGTVYRGNGNELDNVIEGNDSDNNLWGREGHDTLYGNGGDDQLIGADGNDVLYGGAGSDLMSGGAGDDALVGGDGADQLDGGGGTNTLRGGLGDDIYVYGADSGVSIIDNSDGGTDWLLFTDDITSDRLTYLRDGDNLIVRVDADAATQVVVTNWFLGEDYQLSYIQPANASGISAWTINRMFPPENPEADGITTPDSSSFDMLWYGTSSAEQLIGTDGADLIRTYQGEDSLFGLAGDDWLLGGSDADYLDGGEGNDLLFGGDGNDQLDGDSGDDTMIGGAGDDIYVYGSGSGADTIDNSGGGTDWLIFTDGITSARLSYLQDGDDLIVRVDNDETTQVTISNWFLDSAYTIDYIQPDGEYGIPAAQIETLLAGESSDFDSIVEGTDSAEQLVGTFGSDQLNAYAGDDQLFGLSGDDELNGGDGADYLDGGAGDDIQSGGAGDDQLGGDAGNDTLIGGTGNDIYIYASGSGADTIDNSDGGTDWLIFTDITGERLAYLQDGDDLIVRIDGDAATQVTIHDWFVGTEYQLAYIQPSGESAIAAATINELFAESGGGDNGGLPVESEFDSVTTGTDSAEQLVGTSGMDLLQGLAGDDQLFGLSGDDWLVAGDGADYLDGGDGNDVQLGEAGADQLGGDAGNDLLIGGADDDIYVYRAGSGADTIDNSGGGTDWLIFTDDITANRLSYHRSGDDLLVKIDGDETTMVTVKHWFDGGDYKLSYIQPSGGYGISATTIESLLSNVADSGFDALVAGTDGADTLTGGSTADQLRGYDGDDQLSGLDGDDELSGDDGNDLLYGGAGDDSYLFNLGDGSDSLYDESGTDSILFGDEVTADGFAFFMDGETLQIGYGTDDVVTLASYSDSTTGNRIETLSLADGRYLSDSDITQIIQDISAYAIAEGISVTSLDDVRQNDALLAIVANAWETAA